MPFPRSCLLAFVALAPLLWGGLAGEAKAAMPSPAATATQAPARFDAAPPGLRLQVSPFLVDVGSQVVFTVSAKRWPTPARVTVSVLSPHHGFSGRMTWKASCRCFQLGVVLARRIHSLETARVSALVALHSGPISTSNSFLIRGLARNGRDFAPGGTPYLRGWVTDPAPLANETEHYCAWVLTADGLGIKGVSVRFVASYGKSKQTWNGRPTNIRGISCVRKVLKGPRKGTRVTVDVFAGNLHVRTSFLQSS